MVRHILAAVALAATGLCPTQAGAAPTSEQVRLQPARIQHTLDEMVSSGRVVGASVLIWKNGREAFYGAAGWADREGKKPLRRDTMMQVWSMTKPVTGAGLMRLWEQGKFQLDDRLDKYLPEYANAKVFEGMAADGKPILKAPTRPILIRDILRHTAGFAYWDGPTYPEQQVGKIDPLNVNNTLAQFSEKLSTIPLMFEPGSQWRYSAAVDVQARLIEVLTGQSFETYMRANVLDPLGMKDSGWTQPESRFARLAVPYKVGPDNLLHPKPVAEMRQLNFSDRKLTMGGAGLASTVDDYMRFARMMLGKGQLGTVRILQPATVRLMSTDQLDPAIKQRLWLPEKGNGGFGFDFFVRTGRPLSAKENRGAVGEFFWDGAWTTLFWVDPANDMAVVFFVQKDPYDFSLHHDIRQAVYGPDYLGPKGNE